MLRWRLRTTEEPAIHDLGCGTGSMARWLAGHLPGRQRWFLYDRDPELLALATADPPRNASDGASVTVETRPRDVTRLAPRALSGAHLITASALLDMLTGEELARLLASCISANCPVLLTLSVTGRVDLIPADPMDQRLSDAFNAHQRRPTERGRLLGPDAPRAAVDGLIQRGYEVVVRPSPWHLGRDQTALATKWLAGWVSAAGEQLPELDVPHTLSYLQHRTAELAAGQLSVTVHHVDLLAVPEHRGTN